jgi:hypothetical protein
MQRRQDSAADEPVERQAADKAHGTDRGDFSHPAGNIKPKLLVLGGPDVVTTVIRGQHDLRAACKYLDHLVQYRATERDNPGCLVASGMLAGGR